MQAVQAALPVEFLKELVEYLNATTHMIVKRETASFSVSGCRRINSSASLAFSTTFLFVLFVSAMSPLALPHTHFDM